MTNPGIEEVREARKAISRQFGHDIHAVLEFCRKFEQLRENQLAAGQSGTDHGFTETDEHDGLRSGSNDHSTIRRAAL